MLIEELRFWFCVYFWLFWVVVICIFRDVHISSHKGSGIHFYHVGYPSSVLTTLVMWLQVVKIKVTLKEIGAGPGSPLIRLFLSNLSNFRSTSTCGKKKKRNLLVWGNRCLKVIGCVWFFFFFLKGGTLLFTVAWNYCVNIYMIMICSLITKVRKCINIRYITLLVLILQRIDDNTKNVTCIFHFALN